MAVAKFCVSAIRLLLLSVPAFIMLSAAVVTEEPRHCHWCGPLAEQVHRSARAPPCDAPGDHVAACEPGFKYCAIVATSPPYIESRYCVKLYQDECYPLFCNSTRTWKMTCPCRGDLCNGPNTDRETEAFAILDKLVAKTRNVRIKKRTQVDAVKFIPSGTARTVIITNISTIDNNELNNNDVYKSSDEVTQIIMSEVPVVSIEEKSNYENVASTDITVAKDDTEKPSINDSDATETTENDSEKNTSPKPIEHISVMSSEITKTEKSKESTVVKPSEELPTAEALQQNTSPKVISEKTTVPTTANDDTTFLTTIADIITTESSEINKSGTDKLLLNMPLISVIFFISNYKYIYLFVY